jgi:hypothetical protein
MAPLEGTKWFQKFETLFLLVLRILEDGSPKPL